MALMSFKAALTAAGQPRVKHLVLGNGFSIALRPDIFTYGSLLDSADFAASPQIPRLFDTLSTQDFELVIKSLVDTARVVEIYRPDDSDLRDVVNNDAEAVKDALVTAIAKRHPDRPYDVHPAQYRACRSFLSHFKHIYTMNYDVLLYWALMQTEVDELRLRPDDGFRHPDNDPDQPYVSWQQSQTATVHYLHGALHLFDAGSEIIKYTWSKTDIPIVDQVRAALDDNKYPLFVAEGDSASKLEKIMHSAYLHKALRSLESCAERIDSAFVIFGHSLAENDDHILQCIGRGRAKTLLVSMHGDENSAGNTAIRANAARLAAYREARNPRHPLNFFFYDAGSVEVWG